MKQYRFASGARVAGDPQEIGEALAALAKNGRPDAHVIVEAAKPNRSPLHAHIWGESTDEAALERRLYLARHLVRSVVEVVTVDRHGNPIDVRRAFYFTTLTDELEDDEPMTRVVVTTDEAQRTPALRARVIRELHRNLVGHYRALATFAPKDTLLVPLGRFERRVAKELASVA